MSETSAENNQRAKSVGYCSTKICRDYRKPKVLAHLGLLRRWAAINSVPVAIQLWQRLGESKTVLLL